MKTFAPTNNSAGEGIFSALTKETSKAQQPWTAERIVRRIRVPLGFLFAAAFLFFARPTPASLLLSLLLVVPGLWLRGYAAGYVKKNAELTTTGPYAYTRNPLYLGSFLAAFGFVAAGSELPLLIFFLLLFFGIYLPVIRSEERFLAAHFSNFADYMRGVPRLFPSLAGSLRKDPATDQGSFSRALYRKHREYNASIGAAALYATLLALHALRQHGILPASLHR